MIPTKFLRAAVIKNLSRHNMYSVNADVVNHQKKYVTV